VELARRLRKNGHEHVYGLTANEGTPLSEQTAETFVLTCGWEQAVAATKSVVEQALLYQTLIAQVAGRDAAADLAGAAEKVEAALTMAIPPQIVQAAADAPTLYFAGYNDGVAEELTLKANEITRKKSDFLEGTYAVHGIEEVMDARDVVFAIEPFRPELGKFREVLADGVGLQVVVIDTQPAEFPTLQVPDAGELNPLVFLAAGWNLLVEIGLARGIDLDKPQRARKVGNELLP
jgi:glucosamine--fructose-6-phosphate aminotransferase (isomerizing)